MNNKHSELAQSRLGCNVLCGKNIHAYFARSPITKKCYTIGKFSTLLLWCKNKAREFSSGKSLQYFW